MGLAVVASGAGKAAQEAAAAEVQQAELLQMRVNADSLLALHPEITDSKQRKAVMTRNMKLRELVNSELNYGADLSVIFEYYAGHARASVESLVVAASVAVACRRCF